MQIILGRLRSPPQEKPAGVNRRAECGDSAVYLRMPFAMKDAMTIQDGREIQAVADRYVWVNFPDAPWARGKTAEDALNSQMALLSDRLKKA
jgi:hypothetical protein